MSLLNAEQIQGYNKSLSQIPIIAQASLATFMSPVAFVIAVALALIGASMIMLNMGVSLVFNLVGFMLPVHKSYQILEQKADMDAHRACLTYWVVFGLFMVVEGLIDWLFFWVPLYYYVRVTFQAWLFYKNFAGAAILFKFIAQPALAKVDEVYRLITKDSITHNVPESNKKQ